MATGRSLLIWIESLYDCYTYKSSIQELERSQQTCYKKEHRLAWNFIGCLLLPLVKLYVWLRDRLNWNSTITLLSRCNPNTPLDVLFLIMTRTRG